MTVIRKLTFSHKKCNFDACYDPSNKIGHTICSNWFDFIEYFTTTFLRVHSWLNWVDEDDDICSNWNMV